MGYDTFGLRTWSERDFDLDQTWRVFEGFYLSDRENPDGTGEDVAELAATASIAAGVEVDAGIASAQVTGGVRGNMDLDFVDGGEIGGTDDGRIRASEVIARLESPWELFQVSGAVELFINAAVSVLAIGEVWSKDLATFQLASFTMGPKGTSAGTAFDGAISGGRVFFDANLNGVLDPTEPRTYTTADGLYTIEIPLGIYDLNKNGKVDAEEGQIIVIEGYDVTSGLDLITPLISTPESTVASPLTTLAAKLAEGPLLDAEKEVKQVLGLSTSLDLFDYEIKELSTQNLALQGQLQNLVILATQAIAATDAKNAVTYDIATAIYEAVADKIESNAAPNLTNVSTIKGELFKML